MISEKIKNLFILIDFLHTNIENFNKYDAIITKFYLLVAERNLLKPQNNYKERLKYNELQIEIDEHFAIIDKNINQVIKSKVIELNICDWGLVPNVLHHYSSEITNLTLTFASSDIPEILECKIKYGEFRNKTNCDNLQVFFSDLDRILNELFDYFKLDGEVDLENQNIVEFKNFEEFLEYFKNEALQVDLSKRERQAYDILEAQKTKLSVVKFDSQLEEIIKFSEEAIVSTTDFLIQAFNKSNVDKEKTNKYFLNNLKAYFEYTDVYNKALELRRMRNDALLREQLENDSLVNYKSSFNVGQFVIRLNLEKQRIVTKRFVDWYNETEKNFAETTSFGEHKDLIFTYNKSLLFLSQNIVLFYKSISNYLDTNDKGYLTKIVLQKDDVLRNLETINSYSIKIKIQSTRTADIELLAVRDHCISQLDYITHILKDIYSIDLVKSPFNSELKELRKELKKSISKNLLTKLILSRNSEKTETKKTDEVYKNQNLFKLGLLFAEGKMNKYFTVNSSGETIINSDYSAPKIEKDIKEEFKIDVDDKFILATLNNYAPNKENRNGNKNIFNSLDMMSKVISHCKDKNIAVDAYFESRLPAE